MLSALGVIVLCTFAYTFHGFDEDFRRRGKFLAASVVLLVIAIFINANPPRLQTTELYTLGNYTVMRHRADTLIIGAVHGGEDALLRYLDRNAVNRAALLLTYPPHPRDAERLTQILPRVHTLYLPAHAEGVTESLMNLALAELDLPENIVFLHHGDRRRNTGGTVIEVRALPMGRFEVSKPFKV